MDLKLISLFTLAITIGLIVLVAFYKKWSWYMDNYQSRPMRKMWGEELFAIYTHVIAFSIIGISLDGLIKEVFYV